MMRAIVPDRPGLSTPRSPRPGFRLQVSETCVKKNDLQAVEDRLGKRLDAVEHNIRGMVTEVIGAIRTGGQARTRRPQGPA
jgi:hypothetical protein